MTNAKVHLAIIVLLAGVLRFYELGKNPPSLDWDEASIGYNAYSLLRTGKDEYGNSWPLAIRSFNDYKPPLYTYFTIPTVALFGLTEFAVRFPSALAGTLTVLVTYLLVKELFPGRLLNIKHKTLNIGETAAFLLAISPWHLQFSRVAFEANLALFWFVLGVYALIRALNRPSSLSFVIAAAAFIATIYTYHSARVVVPLFALVIALVQFKRWRKFVMTIVPALLTAMILLIPLFLTLLRGSAQKRFTTVSVFTNPGIYTREEERLTRQREYRQDDEGSLTALFHHRWLVLAKIVTENYFDHMNLEFLFLRGDGIGRHSATGMGLLYYWELPFLLAGAYFLVRNREPANLTIFPWLAAAPAASAMTTQTPHAVRSLLMVVPLIIINAYGVVQIIKALKRYWYLLVIIGLLVFIGFIYYMDLYYIHTPVERSHDWQYGYRQLVETLIPLESEANEIIITTRYDQPYIFILFYKQVDPRWYQPAAEGGPDHFGKYFFRKIDFQRDRQVENAIIVGTPDEIPDEVPIFDRIRFMDGSEAFRLVRTQAH